MGAAAQWRHLPEVVWASCFHPHLERFHVWGYGRPLFGKAVLLGVDENFDCPIFTAEDCGSTRFTVEELSRCIVWMEPRWLRTMWTLRFQMPTTCLRFIRRVRFG